MEYRVGSCWAGSLDQLPLFRRGTYWSLYVIPDLYSRFIVAWMVSRKENSALASQLMAEATARYRFTPSQFTIDQDRDSQ